MAFRFWRRIKIAPGVTLNLASRVDLSRSGQAERNSLPGSAAGGRRWAFRKTVKLNEGMGNEMPVHAALMLCRARALRQLGLPTETRDTLTTAFLY